MAIFTDSKVVSAALDGKPSGRRSLEIASTFLFLGLAIGLIALLYVTFASSMSFFQIITGWAGWVGGAIVYNIISRDSNKDTEDLRQGIMDLLGRAYQSLGERLESANNA